MPIRDDEEAFESLNDLLGSDEHAQILGRDLFGRLPDTPSEREEEVETSPGFDSDAFFRARLLPVSQTASHTAPLCLAQVRDYALQAHKGQTLEHIQEPHWKHLAVVAGLVTTSGCNTPRAIALAWLHHTVSDTTTTLRDIERTFGNSIADGILCLTSAANPLISSDLRKQRDRNRLAKGDAEVHSVKLADIAAHLASISSHSPDLAQSCHLEETRLEISVLNKGDEGLKRLARTLWSAAFKKTTP